MIKRFHVSRLNADLNQPFRIAVGQHNSLENILLTIELDNGIRGFGEAAVATHITGETIPETVKNCQKAGGILVKEFNGDYLSMSRTLHAAFPKNKAVIAAVEMALIDALTKQWSIPLWKFFGDRPRPLTSDITIVVGSLEETQIKTKEFYKQGFRSFKIKIGKDEDLDIQRVMAVYAIAPKATLILDANQGFSADQTIKFLNTLKRKKISIALIEQPVPKDDWEGLKRVTRISDVSVCADESVSSLKSAVKAIKDKAVDAINIKLMKTGIFESREIARLAHINGIDLMIGGMMESNLAMTASAHMAAGLGCFKYIDLDTPFFIKDHVRKNPFLSAKGIYKLSPKCLGIGITPR